MIKRALREPRTLGLLHVEARRVARSQPAERRQNISRELELWAPNPGPSRATGGYLQSVPRAAAHQFSLNETYRGDEKRRNFR